MKAPASWRMIVSRSLRTGKKLTPEGVVFTPTTALKNKALREAALKNKMLHEAALKNKMLREAALKELQDAARGSLEIPQQNLWAKHLQPWTLDSERDHWILDSGHVYLVPGL
ncbi:unnamed protein product [Cercospora beticola]|nr:unnamed protein product [Cercospora beticola]